MSSDFVIIGKNIIEILTTGMYHNPLVIFREYVQNSVDAINEAVNKGILDDISEGDVQVIIDREERQISFEDNGIGVPKQNAWQILTSIAASGKDRTKNLGFRGIGRLAGLAYCDELIIETSFKGESTKTVLQWDGQKLREIIGDKKDRKLATEVIEAITTTDDGLAEKEGKHYFKVILQNVKNEKLLDIEAVKKYLRMVAPVDFANRRFIFTPTVKDGLAARDVACEGYRIFVNTNELFKSYRTYIYKQDQQNKGRKKSIDEVIDIYFFDLHSKNNHLLAVGWYAITKYMRLIPACNEAWGIRFRKGNIQVGDEFTLQRFFRENRFHRYFLGEIHVVHDELFPNGQRDYFNECELLSEFEEELYGLTSKLQNICRKASEWNSAEDKINKYKTCKNDYNNLLGDNRFYGPSHKESEEKKLNELKEEVKRSEDKIELLKKCAEGDNALKRFIEYRLGDKVSKNGEKENVNLEIAEENLQPQLQHVENHITVSKPIKCSIGRVNHNSCESKANQNQEKKEHVQKRIPSKKNGGGYITSGLTKLTKEEQKLVGEILEISRIILPPDLQQNFFAKIEERFRLTKSHD
jgi:molecular chaperone HtpG